MEVTMGFIRGYEWLIILAVVILIFGPSQIPKLAKSVGSAFGMFKSGVKDVKKELEIDPDEETTTPEKKEKG
jgi:sec-independent protein translocase protein TatA